MTGLTPDITAGAVVRHGVLRLTFSDGVAAEVEVLDRMAGPVFELARTHGWVRGGSGGLGERNGGMARWCGPCS